MILVTGNITLRKPEPEDIAALYTQKNDPVVASQLGGFSRGYSISDVRTWVESRNAHRDDLLWVIADSSTNDCLGHAGLYQIDHRVRSAEYAIMVGRKDLWGSGIGTTVTNAAVRYGFHWLNLNRIQLTVLETNDRALKLYEKVGFRREGVLREAAFSEGHYVGLIVMSLMRDEYINDS